MSCGTRGWLDMKMAKKVRLDVDFDDPCQGMERSPIWRDQITDAFG